MTDWNKLYTDGIDTAPMNVVLFRDLFKKISEASEKDIETILDIGGGTGRLGIKLAKEGFEVTVSDKLFGCTRKN